MIDEITVRDLALIESASLCPSPGLTVLTGETGAGKSALLSALKLLMGARSSADMVREGARELVVSGRFVSKQASAPDVPSSENAADELIVTRRVTADGRSRATIDGEMASMHELADAVAPTVDLCGQFEHQQLMKTASHLVLLDAWAGDAVAAARKAYAEAYAKASAAASELERVRDAGALSAAKLDEARFALRRIDEANPVPGEYESLKHDLDLAEHAEAFARSAQQAHESLAGDTGALDALSAAVSAFEAIGRFDASASDMAQSLREAGYVLEDAARSARDYIDQAEFDPDALMQQQERFSTLQGLLRAFGPRMEDVFAHREEAAEIVSLVDEAQVRLDAAERAQQAAEAALSEAADALDRAREEAAPRFAQAVTAIMGRLEMGSAELVCAQRRLERAQWTPAGPSAVEFLYRPAAGMQARPFVRIASGGEVSRVMLAVKVALGAGDMVDTLVFDEVDAGVGGATAVALAQVIADLSKTHQVIVVTHLAQVAVCADTHYVVRRDESADGVRTELSIAEGEMRVAEVARMLSGSVSDASLVHAREMLGV